MELAFLHPWMLVGLAGIALPVIVHLLSRRQYDVIDWGAMQFLELDPAARRRMRLEHFWLLLARMAMMALLAIALARPWANSPLLNRLQNSPPRDIVFVIDSSSSMSLSQQGAGSAHSEARQKIHQLLEDLRGGDTASLIEVRDKVRPWIDSPTRDLDRVREAVDQLPPPMGAGRIADGIALAFQQLSRTTNLKRDVIVLTDSQALGWSANDANLWTRLDELRKHPAISPQLWVMDTSEANSRPIVNFSVDRLQISRELTVAEFPIRISTKVKLFGGEQPLPIGVHLEIDGERLTDRTVSLRVSPNGESNLQFEHRFLTTGSHLVSVVLDHDDVPADNRADAVIVVAEALPVLLIHDDPARDPVKQETFFAQAALTSPSNDSPWIRATSLPVDQISDTHWNTAAVIVLANLGEISEALAKRLREFVRDGGGLMITLGDRCQPKLYHERLGNLLPMRVHSMQLFQPKDDQFNRVANDSLQLPWLEKLRHELGGAFTDCQVVRWWKIENPRESVANSLETTGKSHSAEKIASSPIVAAKLTSGDPLLVLNRVGDGQVALFTTSLDADWNTFPTKSDYVAFLHEVLFVLAARAQHRNGDCGDPVIFTQRDYLTTTPAAREKNKPALPVTLPKAWHIQFPHGKPKAISAGENASVSGEKTALLRWDETYLPGIYSFTPDENPHRKEPFVANYDRHEADLTPLSEAEKTQLALGERMTFVKDLAELKIKMVAEKTKSEFWFLLIWLFVGFLVLEVWMTRRLVRGGQSVADVV